VARVARVRLLRDGNGSIFAVSASGIMTMSDALIGCQPRIDDPSKARPSSKSFSSRRVAGIVVCCHTPGRSMNFKSTYFTSCFSARASASLAAVIS
jgi:hypothetical protein